MLIPLEGPWSVNVCPECGWVYADYFPCDADQPPQVSCNGRIGERHEFEACHLIEVQPTENN